MNRFFAPFMQSVVILASCAVVALGVSWLGGGYVETLLVVLLWAGVFLVLYVKNVQVAQVTEAVAPLNKRIDRLNRDVAEVHGLARLTRFNTPLPLPFGGGWALTADSAALLVRELYLQRPKVVVELGSGVSTLLGARVFEELGEGRVISLDHDEYWGDKTQAMLAASGLEGTARVHHCPLMEHTIADETFEWYRLPEVLNEVDSIDVLVVDGPPKALRDDGRARFPAVPLLLNKLSDNAIVFVDDAGRHGEQTIVEQWMSAYGSWEREFHNTADGVIILRRVKTA